MSVRAMSWVWSSSTAEGLDRFVLLAIADCANDDGEQAWPAVSTLASKTGLSERTVQRCVKSLTALGELRVQANAGRRGCNLYSLTMATPVTQSPPTESHPRLSVAPVTESGRGDTESPGGVTQSPTPVRLSPEPSLTIKNHPEPSSRRHDVEAVCAALADAVEANGSKRPTITERWRTEARLLMDKDGRSQQQVLTAIAWCQQDPFWRSVILSLPKLREKYDQMRLAAQRPDAASGNDRLAPLIRAKARHRDSQKAIGQ